MKKPKAVLEAEAAVMVKVAELEEAKKAVLRIGKELSAARLDVIAAQTTADAELLQCRIVMYIGFSGTPTQIGRAVILRRTPSGILVVRKAGEANDEAKRFKWEDRRGTFCIEGRYSQDAYYELRDVPAEYLPSDQAT